MSDGGGCSLQVCGPLHVLLDGVDLTSRIPAGQARLLLVFLVLHRGQAVSRSELVDALWPSAPPDHADRDVGALLSRLRAVLGAACLPVGPESAVCLPAHARVDLDDAYRSIQRAESALVAGDAESAWTAALDSLDVASRGFLPGVALPWAERQRTRLRDVLLESYELIGEAGLVLAGPRLVTAQRMGMEIVAEEPLREGGYRLAMRACIARGNHAEALHVYQSLRRRLADDLGVEPGPESRALFETTLAASAGPVG
jgi:DNA-binding SARP family transcriptional activator